MGLIEYLGPTQMHEVAPGVFHISKVEPPEAPEPPDDEAPDEGTDEDGWAIDAV